jgi:hypothetical protein
MGKEAEEMSAKPSSRIRLIDVIVAAAIMAIVFQILFSAYAESGPATGRNGSQR